VVSGYSIRTDEWRLTIWLPFNNTDFVAEWDAPIIATELYDHRGAARVVMDFDVDGEAVNVASDPANVAIIAKLTVQLKAMYSYDRSWLVERMANMARGQGRQATADGYINRPPATGPEDREL
jgi:hypothetical protein